MSARRRRPRHTVTVTIAGEQHVLRSDAEPEYTRSVAAHVDRAIQALGDAQLLQPHRTAILAAMVITDELLRTKSELQSLREQIGARAGALAARVEEAARVATAAREADEPAPPPNRSSGDAAAGAEGTPDGPS